METSSNLRPLKSIVSEAAGFASSATGWATDDADKVTIAVSSSRSVFVFSVMSTRIALEQPTPDTRMAVKVIHARVFLSIRLFFIRFFSLRWFPLPYRKGCKQVLCGM